MRRRAGPVRSRGRRQAEGLRDGGGDRRGDGGGRRPTFASAVGEADRLWPGILWFLERTIPVRGHVTDAATGDALEVRIRYPGTPFEAGEQNRSEPRFGRFHAFLPTGNHTLRFEHPDYKTLEVAVSVPAAEALDVPMTALGDDAPEG